MRKTWIAGIACIGLACPATPAAASLFSATGPVIAIVADELFVGTAEGHLDGSGTLSIHSQTNPALICSGTFTSSAELGGIGDLHCSDGATGAFKFQRLSVRRGHGSGSFSRGSMTFAYGLTHEEAARFLTLPKGKKLAHNGAQLELIDL